MEKLTSLKEKSAWANNQTTLNKLGETDGNLTFNGKPVGMSTERPTDVADFDTTGNLYVAADDDVLRIGLWNEDPRLPIGTEIQKIEIMVDGVNNNEFTDTKKLYTLYGVPSIIVFNEVTMVDEGLMLSMVFYPSSDTLTQRITAGVLTQAKVTYYTN